MNMDLATFSYLFNFTSLFANNTSCSTHQYHHNTVRQLTLLSLGNCDCTIIRNVDIFIRIVVVVIFRIIYGVLAMKVHRFSVVTSLPSVALLVDPEVTTLH